MNEVFKKNERSLSEVLKPSDFKAEKIIRFIEENGEITPKDVEMVSGKSPATARRYLKNVSRNRSYRSSREYE